MPDDLKKKDDSVLFKSNQRFKSLLKLKNKIPRINKKLIPLLLILLAIPLTVGLALLQQELRSKASGGDRKVVLGINNGLANVDRPLSWIQADLERIKSETGAYPAMYVLWSNLESKNPNLEVLNYLDSKDITPVISLMPVGGKMEKFDGRFMLSVSSAIDGVEVGSIKFNSSNPAQITKIYVSKTSSGTEDPVNTLAPTWQKGEKFDIFGTNVLNHVDYDSSTNFKFEILSKVDAPSYWILSVKPIKTTPLQGMFSPNKPVFITPSTINVKKFSNDKIADGSMDEKFRAIADVSRQFNKPIIFRYAQEMNTDDFSWSENPARYKEGGGYRRYRTYDLGNTKGSFKKSWERMYKTMNPIAPKIRFFWNPHSVNVDKYMDYFPGDNYVDYIGFDAYSGTRQIPHKGLVSLSEISMSRLMQISEKPILIGETGINSKHSIGVNGSFSSYRKSWLVDGYSDLYNRYPKLKGILYFDVDMTKVSSQPNNWLLSSSPEIASAYSDLLKSPIFQGRFGNSQPTITPTSNPTAVPSLTPIPTSEPGEEPPFGYHDSASCTNITGWACDENNYNNIVSVELYKGPKSEGLSLGVVRADKTREAGVASECGGVNNHGFSITTPDSLKDGDTHRIYAYAIDQSEPALNSRLSASPKVVSCFGSVPTSIPPTPDPSGCVRNVPTISYQDTAKSGTRKEKVTYKIIIKNNDSLDCSKRKLALDLITPTTRWTYSPEVVEVSSGETKTVDFLVTSGPYSSYGIKSLNLVISGSYKPFTVFSTKTLQYNVVQ